MLNIISFLFLLVLFCGNTLNGDYWAYYWKYEQGALDTFQIGFRSIASVCRNIGLSYNAFISVLVIPCYILLFYLAHKFKTNISVFFSLYFAILVFYDINQVRNFVCAVLLTAASYYLLNKKRMIFTVFILIASMFHTIAILYLLLLVINPDMLLRKKKYYIYLLFFILLSLLIKLNGSNIPFVSHMIASIATNDMQIYAVNKIGFGFLIPFSYFLMNVLLVIISDKIIRKSGCYNQNEKYIRLCYQTIILSFTFLPLVMLDLTFDRIFRNFNFLLYFLAGITVNCIAKSTNEKKKSTISMTQLKYFSFLIIYSIIWAFGTVMRYNGFDQLEWDYILNNNLFFN